MTDNYEIKDSGKREEFTTGSKRDTREGKGRFDLIPTQELRRLAAVYEKGAAKYGDNNWRKGQPLLRYVDSAIRHILSAAEGQEDEDHIMHAAWNCFAFAYTQRRIREGMLPIELNDLFPELVQVPTAESVYDCGAPGCGICEQLRTAEPGTFVELDIPHRIAIVGASSL